MKSVDTFTPVKSAGMGALRQSVPRPAARLGAAAAIAQTGASAVSQAVALTVFIVLATLGVGAPVCWTR